MTAHTEDIQVGDVKQGSNNSTVYNIDCKFRICINLGNFARLSGETTQNLRKTIEEMVIQTVESMSKNNTGKMSEIGESSRGVPETSGSDDPSSSMENPSNEGASSGETDLIDEVCGELDLDEEEGCEEVRETIKEFTKRAMMEGTEQEMLFCMPESTLASRIERNSSTATKKGGSDQPARDAVEVVLVRPMSEASAHEDGSGKTAVEKQDESVLNPTKVVKSNIVTGVGTPETEPEYLRNVSAEDGENQPDVLVEKGNIEHNPTFETKEIQSSASFLFKSCSNNQPEGDTSDRRKTSFKDILFKKMGKSTPERDGSGGPSSTSTRRDSRDRNEFPGGCGLLQTWSFKSITKRIHRSLSKTKESGTEKPVAGDAKTRTSSSENKISTETVTLEMGIEANRDHVNNRDQQEDSYARKNRAVESERDDRVGNRPERVGGLFRKTSSLAKNILCKVSWGGDSMREWDGTQGRVWTADEDREIEEGPTVEDGGHSVMFRRQKSFFVKNSCPGI